MSFITRLFGGGGSTTPAPAPLPPAPVQTARAPEPTGDTIEQQRLRQRRRGLLTVLTGTQTVLGATQGKTLLGA